jgi:hypothetical protein
MALSVNHAVLEPPALCTQLLTDKAWELFLDNSCGLQAERPSPGAGGVFAPAWRAVNGLLPDAKSALMQAR